MASKKGGLGRGLDALFADAVPVNESDKILDSKTEQKSEHEEDSVRYIKIHDIAPNTTQPRKTFHEDKIAELAESIKEHGIIQPIVVRRKKQGYEIVAGERRWRAAIKAELSEVPCLIRDLDDEQNMLIAIIENMQREDLNPVEEAEGLNQMITIFGFTQEQVSKSVGKSRPYITNSLRLLKLPSIIMDYIAEGKISAAHGRTLVAVSDEKKKIEICERIIAEGLSVRETEKIVNDLGKSKKQKTTKKQKNPNVLKVEEELKEILGTRVNIHQAGKKGRIEIDYFNKEELERLIELLKTLDS